MLEPYAVITRFLIVWVTQSAVGCAVVPRIQIRRVVCSTAARMYCRRPVRVMVSMKSTARSTSAWERRKAA